MATQEIVRDHPSLPLNDIDPSVVIPESVKRAAALAESYYTQPPETPAEQPDPPAVEPLVEPPSPPETPPVVHAEVPVPTKDDLANDSWAARYNSMRGRWEASQRTIGEMQEQMSQLGDELIRTQRVMMQRPSAPQQIPLPFVTPEEEEHYGKEFVDFARRAAKDAVAPELTAIQQENAALKERLVKASKQSVVQTLAASVPNWQQIDSSERWKSWLRLPDVYSGQIRQKMLNAASQAGNASRVIAFFKGFLAEEAATGHADPPSLPQPPAKPAPRQAALALETLVAPGRAGSASGGEAPVPIDKPIFTRKQIADFYADVRRQAYAGQETLKAQRETEIFAAQREGRVR